MLLRKIKPILMKTSVKQIHLTWMCFFSFGNVKGCPRFSNTLKNCCPSGRNLRQWGLHRLPYCYYYLRVLYFANFCDLEKIAKLSTRKNFYQHIRHSDTIKTCCFLLWNMHNRALLSVSAFSFVPSRAVTSSRK